MEKMLNSKDIRRHVYEFLLNKLTSLSHLDKHCQHGRLLEALNHHLEENPQYKGTLIVAENFIKDFLEFYKPKIEGEDEEGQSEQVQIHFEFYGSNKVVKLGNKVYMLMSKMEHNDIIAVLQKENKANQATNVIHAKKQEHWFKYLSLLDGNKYKTLGDL